MSLREQLNDAHLARWKKFYPPEKPQPALVVVAPVVKPEAPAPVVIPVDPAQSVWPSTALVADEAEGNLWPPEPLRRPTVRSIQIAVVQHFDIRMVNLLSERRDQMIVRPRQIGMYLSKRHTTQSLPQIGKLYGGKDHTTVLHAVRKIEGLLPSDEKLAADVAAIETALGVSQK